MIRGNEKYWMEIVAKDRKILDEMEKSLERNSEFYDKKDVVLTQRFVTFMDMIFKYNNLTFEEIGTIKKKVIRIHSSIPTKELDFRNIEYVIFNGLYVVSDVMFLDPKVCKLFYKRYGDKSMIEEGLIPENIKPDSIKFIKDNNDNEIAVAIMKESPLSNYITMNSKWSYPIF